MPKILFAARNFHYPLNGAAKSAIAILNSLKEIGEVEAAYCIGSEPINKRIEVNGISSMRFNAVNLLKYVANSDADLVITQCKLSDDIILAAKCKTLLFVRDSFSCICSKATPCPERYKWRLRQECSASCSGHFIAYREAYKKVNYVIANSNYTSSMLTKFMHDNKADVIYPPVVSPSVITPSSNEYILFVGKQEREGITLFREIASKMKEHKFAIAGVGKRGVTLFNINYFGILDNVNEAYRQAKLILCMDQEPTTFDRVPREAGYFGIPTVASNSGGLPESVGSGGILVDDYTNPDAFIVAINEILNEKMYREYSNNAKIISEKSDTSNKILEYVKAIL